LPEQLSQSVLDEQIAFTHCINDARFISSLSEVFTRFETTAFSMVD
jgi:hypothetical protein